MSYGILSTLKRRRVSTGMVFGARQSLQFFRQMTCFLGNNRTLSKFKYCILHYLISIIKLKNNYPVKPNFVLTTRATLTTKARENTRLHHKNFRVIIIVHQFQFLFNRDLNQGCLVYMFSLRFSSSKFLIKLRRQFRVQKIFSWT